MLAQSRGRLAVFRIILAFIPNKFTDFNYYNQWLAHLFRILIHKRGAKSESVWDSWEKLWMNPDPRYPQASTITATFPYPSKACIEEGIIQSPGGPP